MKHKFTITHHRLCSSWKVGRLSLKGNNNQSKYYTDLLDQFNNDLTGEKVLFYQDIARVHKCVVALAKINQLSYEMPYHPRCSTDLVCSDYFLFLNLTKWFTFKQISILGYSTNLIKG